MIVIDWATLVMLKYLNFSNKFYEMYLRYSNFHGSSFFFNFEDSQLFSTETKQHLWMGSSSSTSFIGEEENNNKPEVK